jgi:hypothetical protein
VLSDAASLSGFVHERFLQRRKRRGDGSPVPDTDPSSARTVRPSNNSSFSSSGTRDQMAGKGAG